MSLASLDGTVLPLEQARISVTDDGLVRGDGCFEVIRLYGGRPFALDDHLRRLVRSASGLRLELDVAAVRQDVDGLLAAAPPEALEESIRIMLTRGGRRIVILEDLAAYETTLDLACVTFAPTLILDNIKSLSYGGNMLASRLARERGADEALLVTPDGRALEAPTSSLFWVRGDELITPPLDEHILDSITRRRLVAALEVREERTPRETLLSADEAFLASTTREVQAIRSIDGQALGAAPGPRTQAAGEAFRAIVEDELRG
jgi:branched-chain amino acid aminotransferase